MSNAHKRNDIISVIKSLSKPSKVRLFLKVSFLMIRWHTDIPNGWEFSTFVYCKLVYKRRLGMIANETTAKHRPEDMD